MPAITDDPIIIPDRGEFVDALDRLRRGHVMVQACNSAGGVVLDGGTVYTAHRPILAYGLVEAFDNPHGFHKVRYYRLTARGREFANRVCESWRRRPLIERLAVRLTG
ncbi:MAG: hypothetical protein MUF03_08225 [Rubrivivax sp.]|jgi:hypothetical protein|nr:hypothetical protein [Rubrivivax sp.]